MSLLYNLFILLTFLGICQADYLGKFCFTVFNISSNTQLANINALLGKLVSNTPLTSYNATSHGIGRDRVYGLAQCRGDVSSHDCITCIQDAAKQVRQVCPDQADASVWYDFCFLRYANYDFVGKVDTAYGRYYASNKNVTDPESFKRELGALIKQISVQALLPNNHGLGRGSTKLSKLETLYALVQCTRDINHKDCLPCLAIPVGNFLDFCYNRKGCKVMYSSCSAQYEFSPFFFPLDRNKTKLPGN